MTDAALRREIGITRLRLAIQVARQAGDTSRALRFVLMGAEAIRSEHNLREFLFDQRRLIVRFAEEVTNRLILRDADRVNKHGSVLAHMIGHFAATKTHISCQSMCSGDCARGSKARWSDYQRRKERDAARAALGV